MSTKLEAGQHAFVERPHRTVVALSFPVLLSITAEPITGLVDTFFVAKLGAPALAAMGASAIVLSTTFWIFNFLGISTQTEVARADGEGDGESAGRWAGQALLLTALFSAVTVAVVWPLAGPLAELMGAGGDMSGPFAAYLRIRLLASPAVIATTVGFGVLRGLQDMRTPLYVAVGLNALNIALDPLLIFGSGPVPAMGIEGAAWASTIAQWLGMFACLAVVARRVGVDLEVDRKGMRALLSTGGDLFIRSGCLTLFLLLATREATRLGSDAGAVHQVMRQVWVFTALFLDAFAITGQTLVAFFLGADARGRAREAAKVVLIWSVGTGVFLGGTMLASATWVAEAMVPATARPLFFAVWVLGSVFQPLNAVSFATDGLHWGARDFRYLRNGMLVATVVGGAGLYLAADLVDIWWVTGGWITVRSAIGYLRIWPGWRGAPLGRRAASAA